MANKVYRWKAPELTVTLTSGGTLDASATYYIFGFFTNHNNLIPTSYNKAYSPILPAQTFTTTDTNKSVSVAWKTSGIITSFEDSSVGKVKVNSTMHCLDTGNTIVIDGSYAGTYPITYVDYNSFTINGSFGGDASASWTCSVLPNLANGIEFYISKASPFNSDNVFVGSIYGFSHNYINRGYITNPVSVTAPYNTSNATYNHWPGYNYPTKQYSDLVWTIGKPAIVIDTGNTTITTLSSMINESGISPTNIIMGNLVKLTAHLNVTTTYDHTLTSYQFVCEDVIFYWPYLILQEGSISSNKAIVRAVINCKLYNSSFYADSAVDNFPSSYAGSNRFNCNLNIAYSNFAYDGINIIGDWTWTRPIGYIKNSNVYAGMFYMVYQGDWYGVGLQPRNLINVYIDVQGAYTYDIRVYNSINPGTLIIEYENINTSRFNNRKVLYNAGAYAYVADYYFYRSLTFQVVGNDDSAIDGVALDITDNQGSIYNYTSDASGNITVDLIEQYVKLAPNVGSTGTNTYYENFVFTFRKVGYETQVQKYTTGRNITDALNSEKVWMVPSPSPVYVNQFIGGTVFTSLISGVVSSPIITGSIK